MRGTAIYREAHMPGKDRMMVNGHLGWKLGVVLLLATALLALAALVVRSWAKQTCLPPTRQPVTPSIR